MSDTNRTIRGCVLVICNSFMGTHAERTETSIVDGRTMKELWRDELGCHSFPITGEGENTDFIVHYDVSAQGMMELLIDFANYRPTFDYSYIAVVISTHGGQMADSWVKKWSPTSDESNHSATSHEVFQSLESHTIQRMDGTLAKEKLVQIFYGNDFRPVREDEMKKLFYNDKAKGWRDIQKFFILSYSRGNKIDSGVKQSPKFTHSIDPHLEIQNDVCLKPRISDILTVHGCHRSYCDYAGGVEMGSWLVSTVGNVFKKYAKKMDVVDMLTVVNQEMNKKQGYYVTGILKTMSVYESSLDRKLYLCDEAKTHSEKPWSADHNNDTERSELQVERDPVGTYCHAVEDLNVKICTERELKMIKKEIAYGRAYSVADTFNKGYVHIVNNNFKDTEDERLGAECDVENMRSLWMKLGCEVHVYEDQTAGEIKNGLAKLAEWPDIESYDFLVVFLMSHGKIENGDELIMGSDHECVKANDVSRYFYNDSCPLLHYKPKLFFFQACRGEGIDHGVVPNNADDVRLDSARARRLPQETDILVSYPTQHGYAAFRNEAGSWFINAIANVFARFAHSEHVEEMMITVRRAVMEMSGTYHCQPVKQMGVCYTHLAKKLFLKPS